MKKFARTIYVLVASPFAFVGAVAAVVYLVAVASFMVGFLATLSAWRSLK